MLFERDNLTDTRRRKGNPVRRLSDVCQYFAESGRVGARRRRNAQAAPRVLEIGCRRRLRRHGLRRVPDSFAGRTLCRELLRRAYSSPSIFIAECLHFAECLVFSRSRRRQLPGETIWHLFAESPSRQNRKSRRRMFPGDQMAPVAPLRREPYSAKAGSPSIAHGEDSTLCQILLLFKNPCILNTIYTYIYINYITGSLPEH